MSKKLGSEIRFNFKAMTRLSLFKHFQICWSLSKGITHCIL